MDIVERLRDWEEYDEGKINDARSDAATEIERLRECLRYEENRFNRIGTHSPGCYGWGPRHYECAMREIERLREALHDIQDMPDDWENDPELNLMFVVDTHVRIAREALKKSQA